VIPESIPIEKGFVGDNCDNNYKQHLYVSPTTNNTKWANDYLFDTTDSAVTMSSVTGYS
jgi:hypothetical protein